jgi:hypothetical protein
MEGVEIFNEASLKWASTRDHFACSTGTTLTIFLRCQRDVLLKSSLIVYSTNIFLTNVYRTERSLFLMIFPLLFLVACLHCFLLLTGPTSLAPCKIFMQAEIMKTNIINLSQDAISAVGKLLCPCLSFIMLSKDGSKCCFRHHCLSFIMLFKDGSKGCFRHHYFTQGFFITACKKMNWSLLM